MIAQTAQPYTNFCCRKSLSKEEKNRKKSLAVTPVHESRSTDSREIKESSRSLPLRHSVDIGPDFSQLSKPVTALVQSQGESSLKTEEAEWLTSKEAADYLRVSEGTLRNWASNGAIPYVKLGRSNRYSRNQLRQLLLSNKRGVLNGN